MKRIISFIAVVIVFAIAAAAQTRVENNRKPDERIIVNKEFDEQGNLLRYDSTYSFQWFSDTTFSFPDFGGWETFFNKGKSFPNLFNDSTLFEIPFFKNFPKDFFDDSRQSFQYRFGLPDSSFFRNFSFQMDTTLFMGPDSSFLLPPGFFIPDMKSLRDIFRELQEMPENSDPFSRFFLNQPSPRFERFIDKDKREELEILMEKHRREMEELYRKWEGQEQKKVY
jgi:hypothetical protein